MIDDAPAAMAELVWDSRCTVGECPVWDEATGRLFFCDIVGQRIYALDLATGARRWWDFPEPVGSFALCRSGRLLVAQRQHLLLFDPRTGETSRFAALPDEPAPNRLNDGKVGPDGCFWVGTMDDRPRHERRATGSLYRIRPDGGVERKAAGYMISNGLAWSPDGTTMFHSDSGATPAVIDRWEFDPVSGRIYNRRRIATLEEAEGLPDGAATDATGDYWSAGVTAGRLNRFSPEGALRATYPVPVPTPTMPAFVEETVFFTSLRHHRPPEILAAYPSMGGVFRMPVGIAGVPIGRFADTIG